MKRNQGKRILAILLSVMLMVSNLGLTAFAEEFTSTDLEENYNEVILDEEIFSSDVEVPPEEVELQLGEDLIDSGESLIVDEAPEESLVIDEELFTSEPAPEDGEDLLMSEPVFEEMPVPFEQTYAVGNRNITVTADAGVFPQDAMLYVDSIENEGISKASEEALGISSDDTVIIRHALYSFSGTEMYGTAVVKISPVGLAALRDEYPDGEITSYVTYWDADDQEARMITADYNEYEDLAEFSLPALTVCDLVTVVRLPEQAPEMIGETVDEQTEKATEQPADEEESIVIIMDSEAEDVLVEEEPVSVLFDRTINIVRSSKSGVTGTGSLTH